MTKRPSVGVQVAAALALILLSPSASAADIEDVKFQSHDVVLSGDIVFPEKNKPIAALVLVHGAGKVERMLPLARLLASDGFAVLTYDKRGVGKSGGVYVDQNDRNVTNIFLLADDAAGAMATLARNNRLLGIPKGFIGLSQAGWILPTAAEKSPAAKFVALWSGPVSTLSEQLHFQDLAENDPKFWASHTHEQVAEYMKSTRYRSDDIDPRTSLSKLHIPGVWLFGGADTTIPVDLSVERLKGLISEGHNNFEYKVFPDYGHNIADSRKQLSYPYMVAWIKKTVAKLRTHQ